jgi:long-chain fatty acid transport protein
LYEPTEKTRLGLSWRLRSTQQVKGDHKLETAGNFTGNYTGWASPALPETVTLSAYHKYKKFGFSGTARWTHWSQSFPEFVMRSDAPLFQVLLQQTNGSKVSKYSYKNAWTLTAGLDYYHNDNWTFRCGTGWDESPAHNDADRTIRIPDNDRFWVSAGASYMQKNWQVDVGYGLMFGRTGKALETTDLTSAKVKYKNLQSHLLGLQVQYKF